MYVYLHENGSLIRKTDFVVESLGAWDYFDSDFVQNWWWFKTNEAAEKFIRDRQKNDHGCNT